MSVHVVSKGDTWDSIAKSCGSPPAWLLLWNGRDPKATPVPVEPGSEVLLPGSPPAHAVAPHNDAVIDLGAGGVHGLHIQLHDDAGGAMTNVRYSLQFFGRTEYGTSADGWVSVAYPSTTCGDVLLSWGESNEGSDGYAYSTDVSTEYFQGEADDYIAVSAYRGGSIAPPQPVSSVMASSPAADAADGSATPSPTLKDLLIHDMRVEGTSPLVADVTFEVGRRDPIDRIVDRVVELVGREGDIERLIIMAHGNYSPLNPHHGGHGIILGRGGIHVDNVDLWRKVHGHVRSVIMFVCSAAETLPGAAGSRTDGDGQYLMSRFASCVGAPVIASSAEQSYTYVPNYKNYIEMGQWEGDVFEFSPDGKKRPRKLDKAQQPGQYRGNSFDQAAAPHYWDP